MGVSVLTVPSGMSTVTVVWNSMARVGAGRNLDGAGKPAPVDEVSYEVVIRLDKKACDRPYASRYQIYPAWVELYK